MPASARQNLIACEGKPAQCFTRRKRSSSAAATSLPSRTSAAAESPWKALRPRIIIEENLGPFGPRRIRLNKQENLASFCQSTTVDSSAIYYNLVRHALSTPVRALKTRGLHIDGARALGAHNVPISLIAQGKMWHRALSMRCPQKSPPVRHARAITVARTQQ